MTTAPRSGAKSSTRGADKCPQAESHRCSTTWAGHAARGTQLEWEGRQPWPDPAPPRRKTDGTGLSLSLPFSLSPPLPMLSSRPRQSARPPARWPAVFPPPTASYGGGVSSDIRRGIEYAEYAEHTEYAEYAATNPPVIFGQTATLPHSQKPTRRTYIEQPTYLACGKNESPPTLFCCGYPI